MHAGPTFLVGPLYWFLLALIYATGLLSIWLVIDMTRPKRASAFAEQPWTRWVWMAPQVAYFVVFAIENLPWVADRVLAVALVVATPFVLALQIAYLLRVAYPSPTRLAARELAASTIRSIPEE